MAISLNVLIVEDRPDDAELIVRTLRKDGFKLRRRRVASEVDYVKNLTADLDLILADYTVPKFDAPRALRLLQKRGLDIPFIVVVAPASEEAAVECMKQGAADCLLKDRLTRLGEAVRRALHEKELREQNRQAEAALRASEERFHLLAQHLPDYVYALDLAAHKPLYFNKESFLGYSWEELTSANTLLEHLFPHDKHKVGLHWQRLIKGQAGSIEYRLRSKSGVWEWIEQREAIMQSDARGKPTQVLVSLTNITERKRAEEAIRESEARLAEAQRIARLGNWDWNITTNDLWWSDEIYRMFGLQPQEFSATYPAFLERVHPDDREFVEKAVNEAVYQKKPYDIDHRIILPDGAQRIVHEHGEVFSDESGAALRMVGTVQDVTRRREGEEQLRKLSAAVEQSANAILITDTEGRIDYVNPSFSQMTGYSPAEVLGQPPRILQSARTPPEVYADMRKTIMLGREWRGEFLGQKKGGEEFWTREVLSPIRNSQGAITHYLVIGEDITEHKRIEIEANLLLALTRAIGEAPDIESALAAAIGLVCEQTDWVAGELWLPSADGTALVFNPACYYIASDEKGLQDFKLASQKFSFAPGEGLPGRVWAIRQPEWTEDLSRQSIEEFPRAPFAKEAGIKAALAVPIMAEGEVLAVISLFHSRIRPRDQRLIDLITAVAVELGLALERKRMQDALWKSNELLERIFSNIHLLVAYMDTDFNFIRVNRTYAEADGRSPDFFVGKNHFDLYPNEENEAIFRRVVQTGKPFSVEAKPFEYAEHPEWGISYWDWTLSPVREADGRVGGLLLGMVNVSERERAEEALRAASAYARSLIEASLDPLVTISPDGKVTDVNQATEAVTGYARQKLVGTDFSDYFTEPEKARAGYQQVFREGSVRDYPLEIRHRDGRVTSVLYNASVYRDKAGQVIGVFAAARDITERARAEQAEREQRALAEALRDTAAALNSTLDLNEVLDRILANVGRVVPHDGANVMLAESGMARVVRTQGYSENKGLAEALRFPITGTPTLHSMSESGQPFLITNLLEYPGWVGTLGTRWVQSYLGAPINLDGRVIGFLNVNGATPGAFTPAHAERLRAFADQAAIAIRNARLHADSRRQTEELEILRQVTLDVTTELDLDVLLERLVNNALGLLTVQSGGIYLYRPELDALEWACSIGPGMVPLGSKLRRGEGLSGKVWETGRSLYVADYATWEGRAPAYSNYDLGATLAAPIHWGDELLGVVVAATLGGQPRRFSERDAHLLSLFADQAAIAIRNAQHYEAERRERLKAQTLRKTSEALSESIHLESTLDIVLDQLGQVVRYDWAWVMLVEGGDLRIVSTRGLSEREQAATTTYKYANIPLFSQAITEEKPLVLSDTQGDPRWEQMPGVSQTTRAWVGAPLIASDVVIGLLCIGSSRPDAFDKEALEAIAAFVQQAALAVRNAHLITELGRSLSELQEAEAHLTRTAHLSVAGEIAAGVAHQINNPLTTIVGQVHLLLTDLPASSPSYKSAETIRRAAYRAGTVVQRMLDLARQRPYDFQPINVNATVENMVALVRGQIEPHIARLAVDLDPGLPALEASQQHLEDVWLNLLLNARDAIANAETDDGVIKVTTRLNRRHDMIEVAISDNGPGIPPDEQEQVFTPFFTTKKEGTGLGLSICQDIVAHHGGQIRVKSEVGQGAVFTVELPLAKVAHPSPGKARDGVKASRKKEKTAAKRSRSR